MSKVQSAKLGGVLSVKSVTVVTMSRNQTQRIIGLITTSTVNVSRVSQTSSSPYSSTYTGRYGYGSQKSDGGVIGPFSGSSYRIFVDREGFSTINSDNLTLGNLDSFMYWSKDNSSFSLGNVDNFPYIP